LNSSDERDDATRTRLRRVSVVSVDDSGKQQRHTLTGLTSEQLKRVVHSQQFGFSSVPPAGSEGLLAEHGGRSDRSHVFHTEHPDYRPTGYSPGDSVLYDAHGNICSLIKKNINIVGAQTITLKAQTVIFDSQDIRFGGADASRPCSAQGTVDSCGCVDSSNFSTSMKTT
jgi:phage baseplate assembly protein V